VFYDQPIGESDGLTFQLDHVNYGGGDFLTSLPEQKTYLVEAGYYFGELRFEIWTQYNKRDYVEDVAGADSDKLQFGVSWYPRGHNTNLNLGYARISTDGGDDRGQIVMQPQIFQF
jgi:hypothetical protein